MSKFKSPREKKAVSLNRDRRNTYGENDKSSRKNIPLSKQHSHQAARRAANQPLAQLVETVDDEAAVEADVRVRVSTVEHRRKGFVKCPDEPLKAVLERRKTRLRLKG
jgi:hypothetical protein